MAEQDPKRTGVDLYTFRDGGWHVHQSYSAKEEFEAKEDAKALQSTGEYVGICVVSHPKKSIIFSHNTRGDTLTYTLIVSGGSKGYVGTPSGNIRKAKVVDRSSKKVQVGQLLPLIVILVSLATAGLSVKIVSEGHVPLVPAFIIVLGLAVALLLYVKQSGEVTPNTVQEDDADKKWQKVQDITRQALTEFKQVAEAHAASGSQDDNHFGMILMALGIEDWVIKHCGIPEQDVHVGTVGILDEFELVTGGLGRIRSELFEYIAYPRYRRMFDKGSFIVETRMDDEFAKVGIEEIVEYWIGGDNSQHAETEVSAVLFTDIVDFTSSHQRHGDSWMVDVVKAHNDIVRTALRGFDGKEVKHTGDGIMASFPTTELAVQGAMAMQKGFMKFTDAMPERAFDVRIGISAGKPVHMGNDIFGTPVNLAARVMALAKGREIMLTEEAYKLCHGIGYSFQEIPGCVLKGFDEEHTLYRIDCGADTEGMPRAKEEIGEAFDEPDKPSFLKGASEEES